MRRILIYIMVGLLVGGYILRQNIIIDELKGERDVYRTNTQTLMADCQMYRTKDSLSAAKVGELRLTLDEYKQYRAKDAEIIETLRLRNKELSQVTSAQTEAIYQLSGRIRDSTIVRDTIREEVRCVDISNAYIDVHGCASGDEFHGTIVTRDSIIITESIEYKRFMGFLWKTKKIKSKEYDVINRNPYAKFVTLDVINIK